MNADGGLMPPSAKIVRDPRSLTGFTLNRGCLTNTINPETSRRISQIGILAMRLKSFRKGIAFAILTLPNVIKSATTKAKVGND